MFAKITVKKRKVKHNDPEAAGWTDGYWWTVEDHLGVWESGSETRAEAVEHAKGVARNHGVPDDLIELNG